MPSPLAMALSFQPPQAGTGTVAPTDVAGIVRDNYAQKMQQYNAEMAQRNAMFGGLAGLGGAGIGALGSYFRGAGAGAGGAGAAGAAAGGDAAGLGVGADLAGSSAAAAGGWSIADLLPFLAL